MKISKRLRAISDFVSDNSFILDIGCDHALLDIYTVLNKTNVKAIASDIKPGPLKFALDNVLKYDVLDKVSVVLGDGFSSYKEGVDTVIMSGLGSNTIVSILLNGKEFLKDVSKLIISSNNDYYFLRKSICNLGYYIVSERIIFENGKYYPIILFMKGNSNYSYYELKYGPLLIKNKDKLFLEYIKTTRNKLIDIRKSLTDIIKKREFDDEIEFLDLLLK